METIHNLTIIPEQQAINSVAEFNLEFQESSINLAILLTNIKETILKSEFMLGQNHADWMSTRGSDFIANPKLFACAPLTYVCAFLGEVFNNCSVVEIQTMLPKEVIQQALARLSEFQLH